MPAADAQAIHRLFEIARAFVPGGDLPAAQVAVAADGELQGMATFGAPDDALFVSYSVTKAVTASLAWLLVQDDERIFRGFAPSHSPAAFGHLGVGGQVAWADPATGISFCLLTSGLERNPIQLGMRGLDLSEAATASSRALS